MLPPADDLAEELHSLFDFGFDAPLGEDGFDRLALRVFEHQFASSRPYAAYCRRRARTPDTVWDWRDIPAVPTAAYKELPLVAGKGPARLVFRTSGTTQGPERRGEHHVLDPELYRASLLPAFRALVLPDVERMPILSLIPPPQAAPDSSLSYMAGVVLEKLGQEGSGWFMTDGDADTTALQRALRQAQQDGRPVCLLGTSFALVHLMDRLRRDDVRFLLPPGSRLMDTGGYKGRSRVVLPANMRADYLELLGIPASHQVNEYGMTELLSQYYDAVLRDHVLGGTRDPRRKVGPPWLRAVVVDPETLEPVPPGTTGILRHVDLANLYSVAAVQTEDLGREVEGGFMLLGRAAGAPPRGCSIAADLLLQAARARTP